MEKLLQVTQGVEAAPSYTQFNKCMTFTTGAHDRNAHLVHRITTVIKLFLMIAAIAWLVGMTMAPKYEWKPCSTTPCKMRMFANTKLADAIKGGKNVFTSAEQKHMGVTAQNTNELLQDGDQYYSATKIPHPVYTTSNYCLLYGTALFYLVTACYLVYRMWRFKFAMFDDRKTLLNMCAFEANMIAVDRGLALSKYGDDDANERLPGDANRRLRPLCCVYESF